MNRFNLMTLTAAVALAISSCVSTTRAGGEPTALMSKADYNLAANTRL